MLVHVADIDFTVEDDERIVTAAMLKLFGDKAKAFAESGRKFLETVPEGYRNPRRCACCGGMANGIVRRLDDPSHEAEPICDNCLRREAM